MTKERKQEPTVRVTLDLCEDGVRNIVVHASTAEARDAGIERLRRCLPQLELLEAALAGTAVE